MIEVNTCRTRYVDQLGKIAGIRGRDLLPPAEWPEYREAGKQEKDNSSGVGVQSSARQRYYFHSTSSSALLREVRLGVLASL